MKRIVSFGFVLSLALAAHAGRPDQALFLRTKAEILKLATERIRTVGSDYERVVVAGENRTKALHDNYKAEGGIPPTRLEDDLKELRGACQKTQRLATAGRLTDPDPLARQIIDRQWANYRASIDDLLRQIFEKKREGVTESRIYWETLHAFYELREQTVMDLLYNTPSGERSLDEALSQDESTLLKACEASSKKTRGKDVRVVTPHEFEGVAKPDIQAFYRSLDLVPDARPLRMGIFTVPPGSRTVTLREAKSRMVFRPKKGKGIAYVGQTETEFNYDYLAVPPDTAYYFENTGSEPLELEFVGIKP